MLEIPSLGNMKLEEVLDNYGKLYSQELEIDLRSNPFQWLIASILFGNRIATKIAKNTFLAYRDAGLTTPQSINQASRRKLIEVHGEGGYVRYDGITATYMKDLDGKLEKLDELSQSPSDLRERILQFKGVGPLRPTYFCAR